MLGKLFKAVWRTLSAVAVLALLLVFIVAPLAVYFGVVYQPTPQVANKSALVVHPAGTLVEQAPRGIESMLGRNFNSNQSPSVVLEMIEAVDDARDDDRIKKLYLKLDQFDGAQPGQLQDIVRAIDRFKQSGKPVIAWSDNYSQAQYELASHADRIVLDPMGQVQLSGYGVYRNYFADAIDKLGIKIHVFRHGKYKSFAEPLMRNDMSPAAEKANQAWTTALWQSYRGVVTDERSINADAIKQYADQYIDRLADNGGDGAQLASEADLVDEVAPWAKTAQALSSPRVDDGNKLQAIGVGDYAAAVDAEPSSANESEIARIVVSGEITAQSGRSDSADSQTLARLFRTARADDQIAAVLVRVNSPGGGIKASESIRRQVERTQAAGKPVVVSMAGVAASGGYWLSMNADQIWAEPSTITGSIGVFGLVPTAAKPLNDLGIHSDGIGTTPLSGVLRINHPLSERGRQLMQSGIDYAYQQFVTKVADARDLSLAKVKKNAQGRVWTGQAAHKIGLVDHLGGPVQATEALAETADLKSDQYRVRTIRPPSALNAAIKQLLSKEVRVSVLPDWLSGVRENGTIRWLKQHLSDPKGRYARCFCHVEAVPNN